MSFASVRAPIVSFPSLSIPPPTLKVDPANSRLFADQKVVNRFGIAQIKESDPCGAALCHGGDRVMVSTTRYVGLNSEYRGVSVRRLYRVYRSSYWGWFGLRHRLRWRRSVG